jgi:hypothetical protein
VFPYKFHGRFFDLFNECHWNFDGNCIKHVDYFWEYRHFYYVDSTNPWAWEISPLSIVFLNLFLQKFLLTINFLKLFSKQWLHIVFCYWGTILFLIVYCFKVYVIMSISGALLLCFWDLLFLILFLLYILFHVLLIFFCVLELYFKIHLLEITFFWWLGLSSRPVHAKWVLYHWAKSLALEIIFIQEGVFFF